MPEEEGVPLPLGVAEGVAEGEGVPLGVGVGVGGRVGVSDGLALGVSESVGVGVGEVCKRRPSPPRHSDKAPAAPAQSSERRKRCCRIHITPKHARCATSTFKVYNNEVILAQFKSSPVYLTSAVDGRKVSLGKFPSDA